MATSPRKNAPAFAQTWDESDAAFLDPKSLPIQRLPRAWDRKQEVKTAGNGKQKEIWRKYGTRSRTSDATAREDLEDDTRARAVKRQQRMSPKAIEKAAASRFSRTRAFEATRWDRRKSVLPRKKATGAEISPEVEEDEEQDTTTTDLSNVSFSEITVDNVRAETQEMTLLPEGEHRRSTFTFLLDEDENASYPKAMDDTSASTAHLAHTEHLEQDATLTRLFQASHEVSVEVKTPAEPLSYPELPTTPASEEEVAVAIDRGQTCEEGVERDVDEKSVSVQPADDVMDEDKPTEVEPSAQRVAGGDSEVATTGVAYPALPQEPYVEESADRMDDSIEMETTAPWSPQTSEADSADFDFDGPDKDLDENFTEASLQLNIQRDMQLEEPPWSNSHMAVHEHHAAGNTEDLTDEEESPSKPYAAVDEAIDDIASGLTLGTVTSSREPTPRKLGSPSPPPRTASGPEDATMTFAFDDDTALLKDFLSRAAVSKANKAENIARRESLQNRRDSDVIRHALASPRKALEDKDPNSPSKYDNDTTLNLSQTLTLDMDSTASLSPSKAPTQAEAKAEDVGDSKAERMSRRSSRVRTSRLPAPSSIPTGPPKISVKRDGGDPVVLKKTDAQELGLLTRSNTRKNKQGAMAVNVRLLKLSNEARTTEANGTPESTETVVQVSGKKCVRWDSQLAHFQENTEAIADALADAESLATPDELSTAAPVAKPTRVKVPKVDKDATPKVRKVKNLGSRNGTPGKGLLTPASLLPDAMKADTEELEEKQRIPKPKTSRIKKLSVAGTDTVSTPAPVESKLPVLDIAPIGIDPTKASSTKERKSRLATPRKVKLPQLPSTALGDGKENQGKSIAAPAPKKSIPMPSVVIPTRVEMAVATTGLPRRRVRKM
ncbi:hypothetical protein P171DRAFT_196307 [Karstenula rhodostoma CBS 690.94]|uniref:Uncharacterized protein n=1 Tax=Karstenula rhodostoma CBS 690.94 TaxID=1392251 RepID=A0A9P4UF42_9PLEO|nr:hypothetical protein P171DRAFT_196307 [Karstenula rhodostoma CBS 690.94]